MRILRTLATLVALAGPVTAQPLSTGGSNMPPDFYPKPKCEPTGPMPVRPGNDPDAMIVYNLKVTTFNKKATALNLCMKVYVDAAQNDINAIQKQVRDAVAEANAH